MRQSNVIENPDAIEDDGPLPEMPCSWWELLLLGDYDAKVSVDDVQLVFRHIRQRLVERKAPIGAFPGTQHEDSSRATLSEGQDSGPVASNVAGSGGVKAGDAVQYAGKMWIEKLAFITTIGELHEAIKQRYGATGWWEFQRAYHEATGLKPKRQPVVPMQRDRSESATSVSVPTPPLLPLPSTAYELEEGVHRALPEMPERVAAFLLHVPRNLPWRYQESEAERSERQALETFGGWTG